MIQRERFGGAMQKSRRFVLVALQGALATAEFSHGAHKTHGELRR